MFYSIERMQFLFWNWSYFQHQDVKDILWAFVMALRFDICATAILGAIPFLFFWLLQLFYQKPLSLKAQRWCLGLFLLFEMPTMLLNLGDAEFINFLGRRYTFDALFFFREIPGKFWQLFFYYWNLNLIDLTILGAFAFLLIGWLPKKVKFLEWPSWPKTLGWGLVLFVGLGIGARGGLQNKPINFAHAQIFVHPMMNNLALNSSFTFLQTIKRQSLPRDQFFSSVEMLQLLSKGSSQKSLLEGQRPTKKPNIVLIILESFSLEYIGYANKGEGFTPFLDELASKSIFFHQAYANARRSIEGIGAIMGGVPALMNEPFISSQYLTNYFLGTGTWLQKEGYHTSFFHGTQNGSMYFDQFMKSAGVQNYFGLNEYPHPQDFDGTWGIWDEPFLQWMETKLGTFPQPFFSAVFSLSSHNPFRLPPGYEGRFPKGTSEIHETLGYTDYSLRKFFEKAQKEPWFQNTIFIITADHTYKGTRPEYNNELGHYRIPLMIYSPGVKLPKPDESQIVQHIDILPTILDLIGIQEKEKNYLGVSVFVPGDRFAVDFSDGRYWFITKDYFLTHNQGADYQMFSMKDPSEITPLEQPAGRKKDLEDRLKACIQYFSQGMWDNKLYYPMGR
jgi:phosphoglycerol transferase MdoB-like AlkP superfamily enzyme